MPLVLRKRRRGHSFMSWRMKESLFTMEHEWWVTAGIQGNIRKMRQ